MSKKNIGQSFDDFLKEDGIYDAVTTPAALRVLKKAEKLVRTLRARVLELEAQVAAMRCCGNCAHHECRMRNYPAVYASDAEEYEKSCKLCFEYSHWQPRTESDKGSGNTVTPARKEGTK